jgi:hypothetical protein
VIRYSGAALFATVAIVTAGLATHGTYAGSGDEPHYLAITDSIAFDHDLDLSNNYGPREPLIGGGALDPELHARRGVGNVLRPVHDIGMPVLFAPYVTVARPAVEWMAAHIPPSLMKRWRLNPTLLYRHSISAAMISLGGIVAILMFDVFLRIGVARPTAFWTALLISISPPLLVFSILFFTELPSALICLYLIRKMAFGRSDAPAWTWTVAGLATGLLLLIHIRNLALVIALAAIAISRLFRSRRNLFAYALPLVAMLAVRTLVIHQFWGTWITTPIANRGEWSGVVPLLHVVAQRLTGMLVDQEFGLLPYAPIFVIAAVGIVVLWRDRSRPALFIGLVAGAYVISLLLPISNAIGWTGGWSPAARFLVPIVPLLAVAVAAGVRPTPKLLLIPLVIVQIGIDGYVWQHPKVLWNNGNGRAAICDHLGSTFCHVFPSLPNR